MSTTEAAPPEASLVSSSSSPSSPLPRRRILSVENAYARWAATYDSDNNPLQALDDIALRTLLPKFFELLFPKGKAVATTAKAEEDIPDIGSSSPSVPTASSDSVPSAAAAPPPVIIDLGCGTGRNTIKLVRGSPPHARILGLDISPEMLEVAGRRCGVAFARKNESTAPEVVLSIPSARPSFHIFDLRCYTSVSAESNAPAENDARIQNNAPAENDAHGEDEDEAYTTLDWGSVDAILSTLVLEHTPLDKFFGTCALFLRPGGLLLVSNMHPDMGARGARAGFPLCLDTPSPNSTEPEMLGVTTEKVHVEGYVHGVEEMAAEAERCGFELIVGDDTDRGKDGGGGSGVKVWELAVREEMLEEGKEGGGDGNGNGIGDEEMMTGARLRARGAKWIGVKCWMGGIWRKRME